MKNWKELGEVPDSDGESFEVEDDRDDSDHADDRDDDRQPPDPQPQEEIPVPAADSSDGQVETSVQPQNVYDFPSSPPKGLHSARQTRRLGPAKPSRQKGVTERRQSTVDTHRTTARDNSTTEDKDIWELPVSSPDEPNLKDAGHLDDRLAFSPPSSIGDAGDRYPCSPDERLEQPISGNDPKASPIDASSPEDDVNTRRFETTTLLGSQESRASKEATVDAAQPSGSPEEELGRFGRSLRPRKPIQEHPYLIENVKYTTFMRSHGVKPITISTATEEPRSREGQEDSQDREFVAEESQGTGRRSRNRVTDESSPILFDESIEDRDELAPSPSPKTSPSCPPPNASSQRTDSDQTDATSFGDEEELPSLDKLLRRSKEYRVKTSKRKSSATTSSAAKKRKGPLTLLEGSSPPTRKFLRPSTLDLSSPCLPPDKAGESSKKLATLPRPPKSRHVSASSSQQVPALVSQNLGNTPISRERPRLPSFSPPTSPPNNRTLTPFQLDCSQSASVIPSPRPAVKSATVIDISSGSESDSSSSSEGSSNGPEVVRWNGRRMRGVLPASWLRLDVQKPQHTVKKHRRSPERSPDRTSRRGVALPKQKSPKPSTAPPFFFDDDDQPDEDSIPSAVITSSAERETSHARPRTLPPPDFFDLDDPGSDMEDNRIDDAMTRERKRSRPSSSSVLPNKRRKQAHQSVFQGRTDLKRTQPKITQSFSRSRSATSATLQRANSSRPKPKRPKVSKARDTRRRAQTPPLLSILDVIEPTAPPFIKIAARTARRNPNLGKASPTRKIIKLASRTDNVDALSTLRDWKLSRTRPKVTAPTRSKPGQQEQGRHPLQEVANPSLRLPPLVPDRPSVSRKAVPQGTLDGFARVKPVVDATHASNQRNLTRTVTQSARKFQWNPVPHTRPAQLEEAVDTERANDLRFTARKRLLDAVYKRDRQAVKADRIARLNQLEDDVLSQIGPIRGKAAANPKSLPRDQPVVSRHLPRSKTKPVPRCIDTAAPQYIHANDPVPTGVVAVEDGESRHQDRLKGLGPYGTQYTHHFDVFPLDRGTYFHPTTLIGSGRLSVVMQEKYPERVQYGRPKASFDLDQQTLLWGPWNVTTSSELGIVVDFIAENVFAASPPINGESLRKSVAAADFILRYVLDSLSFEGGEDDDGFVPRCLEVFGSFVSRCESQPSQQSTPEVVKSTRIDVLMRVCVTCLGIHRLAQATGIEFPRSYQVEELLKSAARLLIQDLLVMGLDRLRALYGDQQQSASRDRGIRADKHVANGWTTVIRVLESASIPKGSFWDIAGRAMVPSEVASSLDAVLFDKVWSDMFSILPLCEFDNDGILVTGRRQSKPLENWTVPQQLLKRVFEIYKNNPRQGANFNEYCRAMVGRCHFLAQQWGWRNCTPVIGVIFDFFGSQGLAHLRNEEVFKSASFLDHLAHKPSLSVEPEDRCFHIFLKILAMTIQRFRQLGRDKDIRNLVTRTLPNHNRQFLKEDAITQRDLAALRNHHDLLCTLFWTTPPELRPSIHLIEGLIRAGRSHKEACLINMRAWGQLARFVISSSEGPAAFKPFLTWSNAVFNQVLEQYSSAASDMDRQFKKLSNEVQGITPAMRDEIIRKNKASAMDIIHCSIKSSLDVLAMAKSLRASLCVLNIHQMQVMMTSFDFSSPHFDWGAVHVAVQLLEVFVDRINKASEEQYSSDASNPMDPEALEEAILVLDERLSREFFSLARISMKSSPSSSLGSSTTRRVCVEDVVKLAAKIASRFLKDRVTTQMAAFFAPGKHGLFSTMPQNLAFPERRYLPLFLEVLIRNSIFDFKDLGFTMFGLWMMVITRPQKNLAYENQLTQALKQHGLPFVQDVKEASVSSGLHPNYNSNCKLFECGMIYMRKSKSETSSLVARQLREDYAKILQLVMDKVKEDLAELRSAPTEHHGYMLFVHQIVSLIKARGGDICPVDPFFTQPSSDYSPPVQDPQLHTAGIIAYGVRLSENDKSAGPQLFHYLINYFKVALANGKLDQERGILVEAMEQNANFATYVLQHMLPTILEAVLKENNGWMLLQTYVEVLQVQFLELRVPKVMGDAYTEPDRCTMPMEIGDADMEHVLCTIKGISSCLRCLLGQAAMTLPNRTLHIILLLLKLANTLQPSLRTFLFTDPSPDMAGLAATLDSMAELVVRVRDCCQEQRNDSDADFTGGQGCHGSCLGSPAQPELSDPFVSQHAGVLVADVRKTWVVTPQLVTVQMPGRPIAPSSLGVSSTQAGQGTRYGPWDQERLRRDVLQEAMQWGLGAAARRRRRRTEWSRIQGWEDEDGVLR